MVEAACQVTFVSTRRAAASILCLLLLIQKFVVQPILDAAIIQTIAGDSVDTVALHFIYDAIDCAKMAVLFLLAKRLCTESDARESTGH